MTSKYDVFWQSQAAKISALLANAVQTKHLQSMDVTAIQKLGSRKTWSGRVELRDGQITGQGEMAHARSLGKVICQLGLARPYSGVLFSVQITGQRKLHIKAELGPALTSRGKEVPPLTEEGATRKREQEAVKTGLQVSQAIHRLVWSLSPCRSPIPFERLPQNGLYLMLEDTEQTPDGLRIVRVGINKEQGTLHQRLQYHYGVSRRTSVFRKHVGQALLSRQGAPSAEIERWCRSSEPMRTCERQVSDYLIDHFSFVCIPVDDAFERAQLERWLIGVLSAWPIGAPSTAWLGRHAGTIVASSGLWNVQHVRVLGTPVEGGLLARLQHLATVGLQ